MNLPNNIDRNSFQIKGGRDFMWVKSIVEEDVVQGQNPLKGFREVPKPLSVLVMKEYPGCIHW